MQKKQKRKTIDIGNIIGAVIFIILFVGLILLGIFVDDEGQFDNSFFEDVGGVMQGQYD